MRILLIHGFFHPHKGGSEKYAEELLTSLMNRYPDVSVDVLTYMTQPSPEYEEYKGMRIYRTSAFEVVKGQYYLPNWFRLAPMLLKLSKNNYDLVITQTRFFDPTFWSWIYARLIQAKSLFIGHGTGFVTSDSFLVRSVSKVIDKTIARFSVNRYDKLVVISKATKEFYTKEISSKPSEVIYGGIHTTDFANKPDSNKFALEFEEKKILPPRVLFLGRMINAKGVWVLYEAVKSILAQGISLTLIMAGDGPELELLKEQSKNDSLDKNIVFKGEVSYDDVPALFSACDVFVNPSFNEGLPRTVLEATASGMIVIATDTGSTNEIVIDGKTGFLITTNDRAALESKLIDVVNSSSLASIKEAAQRHTRETFDWSAITEQFNKTIRSML